MALHVLSIAVKGVGPPIDPVFPSSISCAKKEQQLGFSRDTHVQSRDRTYAWAKYEQGLEGDWLMGVRQDVLIILQLGPRFISLFPILKIS